jgi:hypothetical protein
MLEMRDGQPRVLTSLERRGDTLCVRVGHADPRMLDGDGAVTVLAGRVIAVAESDSVACNWNPS